MTDQNKKMKLPRLISDGMVLQRNAQVKIWGWAPAGETVIVRFAGGTCRTVADAKGEWQTSLRTGEAGGPYDMMLEAGEVSGTCKTVVRNILLGDVWICSGQSNMEMKMLSVRDTYPEEVAKAGNDSIRQFLVPIRYDFEGPKSDLETGGWEPVSPQSVLNFTAVGYFFAKRLFEQFHVPIGLINASQGGSPAEAWMSEEGLLPFEEYYRTAQMLKDRNYLDSLNRKDQAYYEEWHRHINKADAGFGGIPFYDPNYNASDWRSTKVPSSWEEEEFGNFFGVVWYRKEFGLPSLQPGVPAELFLGNIIDEDTVYINGVQVGSLPSQYIPRRYDIPDGLLKTGKNTIVIRVVNSSAKGGFYKGKPYRLHVGDGIVDLSGEWQCRIGAKAGPMPEPAFAMWKPSGLYNGMLAPLTCYAIKGVIWYQGESNTRKPEEYGTLFKALIADWRAKWGQGDFPFLYVQLPNFGERNVPSVGNWAALREAQRRTLAVPGTGMAVAVDIGEWNDVHPQNKKDVGIRLSLAAQRVAYGDETVAASGPMLRSAERDGNRIILSFRDTGSGLTTGDGGAPGLFEIAGAEKKFVRADARIDGDCVAVWNETVPDPVYVRYAWADNPERANLYNREGLPASPFTTEDI